MKASRSWSDRRFALYSYKVITTDSFKYPILVDARFKIINNYGMVEYDNWTLQKKSLFHAILDLHSHLLLRTQKILELFRTGVSFKSGASVPQDYIPKQLKIFNAAKPIWQTDMEPHGLMYSPLSIVIAIFHCQNPTLAIDCVTYVYICICSL